MRSRYSAYALGDMGYVARTWHASTRPADLASEPATKWISLRVLAASGSADAADQQTATVEFIATYTVGGRAHKMRELSRFVFEDGRWWYLRASDVQ
jgi:SEC-C motif domain protein